MKPKPSHQAPRTALAIALSYMERAGLFWRGALAITGAGFLTLLVVAFVVPEVYESSAVMSYDRGAAQVAGDVVIQRLRSALLEARSLERVSRTATPELIKGGAFPIEKLHQSIAVGPGPGESISLAFRAGTAELAQRGCRELVQLSRHFLETIASDSSKATDDAKRAQLLEERMRELAGFVAEHPEVANSRSNEPSSSAEPSHSDPALSLLQQQKVRLEARLAEAEKAKTEITDDNPYDPPPTRDDPAVIQQMLAQVKSAIQARQNAASETRPANGADALAASSSASATSRDLRDRWQRLVEAVIEAQRDQPAAKPAAPVTQLVQEPTLPVRPVKPNRLLLAFVGLTGGLWMGVLWAFARVALGHDLRRAPAGAGARTDVDARVDLRDAGAQEPAEQKVEPEPVPPRVDEPPPAPATPSTPPTKEAFWRPPLRLRVTHRGVVDLAAILAQTGTAAESAMPKGVQAAPIVGVGGHPAPSLTARTLVGHLGPELDSLPRPKSNAPPRTIVESRSDSDKPAADANNPAARTRSDPNTRAPAQETAPARPVPRSDPPEGPRSEPPKRAEPRRSRSDPPTGSDPPTQSRSDPPNRPRSEPPEHMRSKSRAHDVPITLREVPLGWWPDQALVMTEAPIELRAIREQLYQFAAGGCFVVGVTSTLEAVSGKSRIAAALALTLAETGRVRVLLVEGDFDAPAVHRWMRVEVPLSSGLSEQVRKRMRGPSVPPWEVLRCSPKLHVLAEGRVRAPGLIASVQFEECLMQLRSNYDIIVVDGPVAGGVDARVLAELADGLVIIGPSRAAIPKIQAMAASWFSKKGWMATLAAELMPGDS